jgi:tetratricopeptide (TPR) repeat protein
LSARQRKRLAGESSRTSSRAKTSDSTQHWNTTRRPSTTSSSRKIVGLLGIECANVNLECARISRALKNDRDSATYSNEAADFFIKAGKKDEAVNIYKEAIEAFKKNGNFDSAGVGLRKVGEYYESQFEFELAAEYFKKAADMFALAKFHTTDATKLNLKVADLYAEMSDKPERLKEAVGVA